MSEKISNARAAEILRAGPAVYDDATCEEAGRMGAAALSAQEELVDALDGMMRYEDGKPIRDPRPAEWLNPAAAKAALDLLVRFGRVRRTESGNYEWTKP